ncbi:hypothetical protein YC2023_024864 [Brassica napus]
MGKTRIEIDRFEGTGDFSLWKVRMMAHFGVLGLKDILTDETLLLDPPKEEAEGDTKVTGDGTTESSSKIDPAKLEKSEKAKDLIIVNVGMDIIRDRKKGILKLSQENYLEKVLKSFNMTEAKAVNTPTSTQFKLKSLTKDQKEEEGSFMADIPYASAVGSIMYAMVGSRPDLGYAVGLISRFMSEPGREHWLAAKWVLRYLKGATRRCLTFTKHSKFSVQRFCDSDYSTDLDRRRSVTGFVFQVWGNTEKQKVTCRDVVEARHMLKGDEYLHWQKRTQITRQDKHVLNSLKKRIEARKSGEAVAAYELHRSVGETAGAITISRFVGENQIEDECKYNSDFE